MHYTNILVESRVTATAITNYIQPYKIEFLPFELTRFEQSLFGSGIAAVFISLPMAYYTVKYYRRYRGAKEI